MPAWAGLWNRQYTDGHSLIQKLSTQEHRINRALNAGRGGTRVRATLLALTGAAVGAASKAVSGTRILHKEGSADFGFGGKRTVETVPYQTGVTTAADLTQSDTVTLVATKKPAYVRDKAITNNGKFGRGEI